jgi:nicotinate phosphoribosyltransferase
VGLGGRDILKLSPGKETWVGAKQVVRRRDADGRLSGDTLALESEDVPVGSETLLETVMRDGRPVGTAPALAVLRKHCARQLAALPEGLRRLRTPESYPVVASDVLRARQAAARDAAGVAPNANRASS